MTKSDLINSAINYINSEADEKDKNKYTTLIDNEDYLCYIVKKNKDGNCPHMYTCDRLFEGSLAAILFNSIYSVMHGEVKEYWGDIMRLPIMSALFFLNAEHYDYSKEELCSMLAMTLSDIEASPKIVEKLIKEKLR